MSNRKPGELEISKPKVLVPFYKMGYWIVEKTIFKKNLKSSGYLKKLFVKEQVISNIKIINPTDRQLTKLKDYYVEKAVLVLVVIFISNGLGLLLEVSNKTGETGFYNNSIERLSYGGGKKQEELLVSIGDVIKEEPISVLVEERRYTSSQISEVFEKAADSLDKIMLGANVSKDEVREDLNFVDSVLDSLISVRWELENDTQINSEGRIREDQVREEGTLVKLKAILTYEEYEWEYETYVNVLPKTQTKADKIVNELKKQLMVLEETSRTEEHFLLPLEMNNLNIIWSKKSNNQGVLLLGIGFLSAIAIYLGKDKEIYQTVEKRNRQMGLDYSEIVSKLTLLLDAGMTVKGAWKKIVLDYKAGKESNPGLHRYAYEEMLLTYYELQGGISEITAYDRFGKRCKIQRYLKLSALLTQNLKKGSKGLAPMLSMEVTDAFEERKNQAKRIGEEAGTKLLLPMFLMLMIVLIIIVVPAFLSFQL